MDIRKTTGIILSHRESGEADVVCDALTEDAGKLRFVFKGLRKSRSRPKGAAEAGSTTRLLYYHREERDSFIVNEFSAERQFPEIRQDYRKIMRLFFLLECVDRSTGFGNPEPLLYRMLSAGIETLASTSRPSHLASFFVLHLLRLHGILPDFRTCKVCKKDYSGEFCLDLVDLRPVCVSCGRMARPLSPFLKGFLSEAPAKKFSAMDMEAYAEEDMLDLLFNLALFLESYYHIRLLSKEILFTRDPGGP